jgi:hypothetical protein
MQAIAQPYQISSNAQEITIKLNRTLITQDELEHFLDYLFIKSIQQKSQLTEPSANELVKEINSAVWKKTKGLFVQ